MRDDGFTLVEVLVALAIFSLAALALLRLQGAAFGTVAHLDEKAIGGIVARNVAVEVLTDVSPPAVGKESGVERNAGRDWAWVREVKSTADTRLQRIDIAVMNSAGTNVAAVTVVRRAVML
ncbi:type II secretion system minor pseudopilin GspI [Sphingoaurantiacus capsulatus]|uniref:Type II secretion system protein I n=1 Tax=Sphingoaurantiacus capsulatus TaxID=1771310 RepID=A0ABV7X8H2_9SPHN